MAQAYPVVQGSPHRKSRAPLNENTLLTQLRTILPSQSRACLWHALYHRHRHFALCRTVPFALCEKKPSSDINISLEFRPEVPLLIVL